MSNNRHPFDPSAPLPPEFEGLHRRLWAAGEAWRAGLPSAERSERYFQTLVKEEPPARLEVQQSERGRSSRRRMSSKKGHFSMFQGGSKIVTAVVGMQTPNEPGKNAPAPSSPNQGRPMRRLVFWVSAVAAVLVIATLVTALVISHGEGSSATGSPSPQVTPPSATVKVPGVIGLAADNAESILDQHGFKVSRQYQYSTQLSGTVVNQQPGPESAAARGSIVTIFISQGQQTNTMPDVRNQTLDAAKQELQGDPYHLTVTVVQRQSIKPTNTVIDQDPLPGFVLATGQTVTLYVSVQVTPTPTNYAHVNDIKTPSLPSPGRLISALTLVKRNGPVEHLRVLNITENEPESPRSLVGG